MRLGRVVCGAAWLMIAPAAARASFGTFTISNSDGTFPATFGDTQPLGIGAADFRPINSIFNGGSARVSVQAWNTGSGYLPALRFANFQLTSTRPDPVTCTITVTQDFVVASADSWRAAHGFTGAAFLSHAGQSASVSVTSTHELLPIDGISQTIEGTPAGTFDLAGAAMLNAVAPVSGLYRITATLTVRVTRGSAGTVRVERLDGEFAHSSAEGIPAPTAVTLAGMAAVGLVTPQRRRTDRSSTMRR